MDSEGLDRIGWVRKDTDTDTDTDGIGWNLEGYGRDGTLVDIFAPVPLTEELLTSPPYFGLRLIVSIALPCA